MAEDAVDKAIEVYRLHPRSLSHIPNISGLTTSTTNPETNLDGSCKTSQIRLVGAHGYQPTMFIDLIRHFDIDADIAQHLAQNYGDRAWEILRQPQTDSHQNKPTRLCEGYPFILPEIHYAINNEYACTAIDVLARRTRLSFLDAHAALHALPKVIQIMGDELKWNEERLTQEWDNGVQFLGSMGIPAELTRVSMADVLEGKVRRNLPAGAGMTREKEVEQQPTLTTQDSTGDTVMGMETARG